MSAQRTIHVVGAGLAGLSCALRLAEAGERVALYEATSHAGGRCRSYFDSTLDRWVDNGNHLLLAGNGAALGYLAAIGARDTLTGPDAPVFPFFDLTTRERWTLHLNRGRLPWWVLSPRRRVPGARLGEYAALVRLARAPATATVGEVLAGGGPLFRRFLEPLVVAVLNTQPAQASAALVGRMIGETFGRGGRACVPLIAARGLSFSFVDPAVARLESLGVSIGFTQRLRGLEVEGGRVSVLRFAQHAVTLGPRDLVVLALPPHGTLSLLPGLRGPTVHSAILNAHFRLPRPGLWTGRAPFVGLIGGNAHWVFFREDVASATTSAADALIDRSAEEIAALVWPEIAAVLDLPAGPTPPFRIIKEKLATIAQTPEAVALRPGTRTTLGNLLLAGDWTDTGLPATIEGAIRSGYKAADTALSMRLGAPRRAPRTAGGIRSGDQRTLRNNMTDRAPA
ncbi:MAG: FAD-dependent oxidoreductase [Rhodospirillaceae bacterium]|nr:FAD-dependent oxidoreductase [Rhodospirillaceae bacterium]